MKEISQKTIENIKSFNEKSEREIGESVGLASVLLNRELETEDSSLSLDTLFKVQEGLNNLIFKKQGIKTKEGLQMTVQKLKEEFEKGPIGANSDSTKWAQNFLKALREEADELEESLPWKWWSKDEADKQNALVEVADLLFFLICIAQSLGLTGEKLFSLYIQKAVVNIERQFGGYSKAIKNENDNKGISV